MAGANVQSRVANESFHLCQHAHIDSVLFVFNFNLQDYSFTLGSEHQTITVNDARAHKPNILHRHRKKQLWYFIMFIQWITATTIKVGEQTKQTCTRQNTLLGLICCDVLFGSYLQPQVFSNGFRSCWAFVWKDSIKIISHNISNFHRGAQWAITHYLPCDAGIIIYTSHSVYRTSPHV